MSGSAMGKSCTICETPGSRVCARCKSSSYCSTDCQLDDWPVHKLLCTSFSKFDVSTRPSETHFRSIVFPQDQSRPKIQWLNCPWRDDEDDGVKWQHPDLTPFMGSDSMAKTTLIRTDALLQRWLPDSIGICYRDTFLIDGSLPTKSTAAILATIPSGSHDWRGPIVAVGREGQSQDPESCRDLDMNDFRYIADYLIAYGRWSLDVNTPRKSHQEVVKGVRINCLGDRRVFGKPLYEPVDVILTDSVFNQHWNDTSDIADRIGFSILTRQCPPSLRWMRTKGQYDFGSESPTNNQGATFLHLCCDPKADNFPTGPSWSWASSRWQNSVGSVIVVRRDKKPLVPLHIEALCHYCQYEIRPLMAHTLGEYAPDEPLARDLVLQMICRPTFSISWFKMCNKKREEGQVISAPYPYL